MRKHVSLLHKALALAKLEAGEDLPTMNQSYFSGLYTRLRKGEWTYGHDHVLQRHRIRIERKDLVCPLAMTQIMSSQGRFMAAELRTHVQQHYERFYLRWRKSLQIPQDNLRHFLDPNVTSVEVLLKHMWEMRRDMEQQELRGFAIFPESSVNVGYIHMDATTIVALYCKLYREKCRGEDGNLIPLDKLVNQRCEQIFEELFHMDRIRKCRRIRMDRIPDYRGQHHFRHSL